MVKHVVCFKLKDNSPKQIDKVKEILLSMRGKVPSAKEIVVGVDFLHSPRSYDIFLEVSLDNKDELSVYQNDKYHVEVVKAYLSEVVENAVAVDFEV